MNIEALKVLVLAATPGPWEARDSSGAGLEIYMDVPSQLGKEPRLWPAFSTANAEYRAALVAYETWVQFPTEKLNNVQARNAAYIAAANPAAVLELIAEVERLHKIEVAAKNLIDQRGRHNTEIAYRRLEAAVKGE